MNKRLYLILLFFAITMTSVAQTEDERYRAIYDQAEQDYSIGRIDDARRTLTANMNDFPLSLRLSAYRLLSLCELTLDNTDAAERCVQLMLDINPYYSTTLSDPQRFIDMVESLKAGADAPGVFIDPELFLQVDIKITLMMDMADRGHYALGEELVDLFVFSPYFFIIGVIHLLNACSRDLVMDLFREEHERIGLGEGFDKH